MAKPKRDPNWLSKELAEAVESLGTVVDERWYVLEITPPFKSWGYDARWTDEVRRRVTPYYSTKEEAEKFVETHEPDHKDNFFEIKSHKLYERTVRTWH